ALPLQQPFCAGGDAVQCITHNREIVAACLGDDKALTLAAEQLDRKLRFQRLHLVAYSALCHTQLLGCARKTFMPGGGFKGLERVQRWQVRAHHKLSADDEKNWGRP